MDIFGIIVLCAIILGLIFGVFALQCMFDERGRYEFSFKGFLKWTLETIVTDYINNKNKDKRQEE